MNSPNKVPVDVLFLNTAVVVIRFPCGTLRIWAPRIGGSKAFGAQTLQAKRLAPLHNTSNKGFGGANLQMFTSVAFSESVLWRTLRSLHFDKDLRFDVVVRMYCLKAAKVLIFFSKCQLKPRGRLIRACISAESVKRFKQIAQSGMQISHLAN